jgi:hypothetical protein
MPPYDAANGAKSGGSNTLVLETSPEQLRKMCAFDWQGVFRGCRHQYG